MIGALVRDRFFNRGIIIDMLEGSDGETKYLIFLENPLDGWGAWKNRTIWAPNENAFEVLSEA